jgi:hypothetical protein
VKKKLLNLWFGSTSLLKLQWAHGPLAGTVMWLQVVWPWSQTRRDLKKVREEASR